MSHFSIIIPLKTLENKRFPNAFRGNKRRALTWKELAIMIPKLFIIFFCLSVFCKTYSYIIQHKVSYLCYGFRIRFRKFGALKWIKNVSLRCISFAHKSVFSKGLNQHLLAQSHLWRQQNNVWNNFKVIIKTPERHHCPCSNVFIANFKHIFHLLTLYLWLNLIRLCFLARTSLQMLRFLPWCKIIYMFIFTTFDRKKS